jgi:hypothetical protein
MGCGDQCPYIPDTRYIDWDLEDPAGQGPDNVRITRDDIERRVQELLQELAARCLAATIDGREHSLVNWLQRTATNTKRRVSHIC